jgi:DNA modification methylase
MNNVKLYTGDCINVMKKIKETVDIVITSPPYNVNLGNNKNKKEGYNLIDDNLPYPEYLG